MFTTMLEMTLRGYSPKLINEFNKLFESNDQLINVDLKSMNQIKLQLADGAIKMLYNATAGKRPDWDSCREAVVQTAKQLKIDDVRVIGNITLLIYNNWEELIMTYV